MLPAISASTMTTATTAFTAWGTIIGFIHAQWATIDFRPVESVGSVVSSAVVVHFNKSETTGATRVTVHDDFG